jgi:hypothetical protein
MGYNYDKTRSNIKVENLSQDEQKNMFKKLRGGGGKVIKEKKEAPPKPEPGRGRRPATVVGGKHGSKAAGRKGNFKLPSEMAREKTRSEYDKKARIRAQEKQFEASISGFWARIQIHFKCWIAGVSPFGSKKARAKVMELIGDQGKSAVMECNILGSDLFHSDPVVAKKIAEELDHKNYLYMEVLERGHKLYKSAMFNELLDPYTANRGSDVELSKIRRPLVNLYRELYYLYPYYNTYLKAAEQAINIQSKHTEISSSLKSDKWKKIRRDVTFLFTNLFPKLYLLIIKADMKSYPQLSAYLEKIIGIDPANKINVSSRVKRTDQEKIEEKPDEDQVDDAEAEETNEEAADDEKEKKEEEPLELPKEIKYGLSLMKMYRLHQLRKKHDPDNEFEKLIYNDKVFLTYLYMNEFDFEYSFVLTTNKIKLNVDYSGGSKMDTHQKLRDIYDELRNSISHTKLYYTSIKEIEEIKRNPSSNYILQSKNVAAAENKKNNAGRTFRMAVKGSMKNVSDALLALIRDMKGSKKIVGNMDEQIRFDSRVEGRKRLNNKKISQCIMEAYCYAATFFHRLESGDLYGGVIEMSDEEFIKSYGEEDFAVLIEHDREAQSPESASATIDSLDVPDDNEETKEKPKAESDDEFHEIDEDIDLDGELDESELNL